VHTTIPLSSTDIHQGQEAYGVPTVPNTDQKFKVIYQNVEERRSIDDIMYDADMQQEEGGNTFTMEQIQTKPNLQTLDFTESNFLRYTYMQPQFLGNSSTEQQPLKDAYTQLHLVTCMQQLQSHETYKQQELSAETYMETDTTMQQEHQLYDANMQPKQQRNTFTENQQPTENTYIESQIENETIMDAWLRKYLADPYDDEFTDLYEQPYPYDDRFTDLYEQPEVDGTLQFHNE